MSKTLESTVLIRKTLQRWRLFQYAVVTTYLDEWLQLEPEEQVQQAYRLVLSKPLSHILDRDDRVVCVFEFVLNSVNVVWIRSVTDLMGIDREGQSLRQLSREKEDEI